MVLNPGQPVSRENSPSLGEKPEKPLPHIEVAATGEQKIPQEEGDQPIETPKTQPVAGEGVLPPAEIQEDLNQPTLTESPKKEITEAEAEVEAAKILAEKPQDIEKLRQMAEEMGEITAQK